MCGTLTFLGTQSNSTAGSTILAILGLNAQDVTGQIGLECSPVTVIGGAITSQCSQQPVCCQNNNIVSVGVEWVCDGDGLFSGLKGGAVAVGCIPIQL